MAIKVIVYHKPDKSSEIGENSSCEAHQGHFRCPVSSFSFISGPNLSNTSWPAVIELRPKVGCRPEVIVKLISILLPVHNAEKTLHSAVVSTLISMPANSELLIFFDACTDGSRGLVTELSDPRIRFFESNDNVGVAKGLNFLLSEATGEFIARMDADDICLPWRFTMQLRRIQKAKVDFVFSNAVLFGSRIKPFGLLPQVPLGLDPAQTGLALLLGNPFVHSSMFASRKALSELGGYRECPSEDYDLWLRALASGKTLAKTWFYGLLYRVHPNQLTKQRSWVKSNKADKFVLEGLRTLLRDFFGTSVGEIHSVSESRRMAELYILGNGRGLFRLIRLGGLSATIRTLAKKVNNLL